MAAQPTPWCYCCFRGMERGSASTGNDLCICSAHMRSYTFQLHVSTVHIRSTLCCGLLITRQIGSLPRSSPPPPFRPKQRQRVCSLAPPKEHLSRISTYNCPMSISFLALFPDPFGHPLPSSSIHYPYHWQSPRPKRRRRQRGLPLRQRRPM